MSEALDRGILIGAWGALGLVVVAEGRKRRPAMSMRRDLHSIFGLVLEALGFFAIFAGRGNAVSAGLPPTVALAVVGGTGITLGTSVVLVQRALAELGSQWRILASVATGDRLVTTGPYAIVRHPIYTAMLGMLLGSGVLVASAPIILLGAALYLVGTHLRIRCEDRLLAEEFGEAFSKYSREVPALFPRWGGRAPAAVVTTILAGSLASGALTPAGAAEPIATFSIVGYDAATGEVGVAVQSKFFAVGSVVPWAKAGVGAIATQAFGNTTFGPKGLEMLAAGKGASEVLDALLAADEMRSRRQVGIVDTNGGVSAYTGAECQAWAGHETGDNFTAQGNILTGAPVVAAMAKAYQETEGMLGEKLMRAIEAGQVAGGDSRGMQSAAIYIAKEGGGYAGFNDRYCDLRVDDHTEPIAELRRIFDLWKVQALIQEGYRQVEAGDFTKALAAGEEAVRLDPKSGDAHYHLACYLSRAGRTDDALTRLEEAVQRNAALGSQAAGDPDFAPLKENARFKQVSESPPK